MSERELSHFFVRELFPLFSEGSIDSIRKNQIQTHLASCSDCKAYYEKLQSAKVQIKTLAGTKVSPAMIEYLKREHYFWKDFSQKLGWKKWPTTIKWAIELTIVTVILISTVHFFPWLRFAKFVNRMRPRPSMVAQEKVQPVVNPPVIPESEATESALPVRRPPETPTQLANTAALSTPKPSPQSATPSPAASPVVIAKVVKPTEPSEDKTSDDEENAQTAGVDDGTKKAGGFVWRGSLKVDELSDEVAAKVTKVILDLGGTKAGQVELGWHRGKQRYYHFILPEENYEKFLSVLNREGLIQLTQERHPRTIKEGHMRIIMTLQENEE